MTQPLLWLIFSKNFLKLVRPFYLHHADWTPGTFSFRTSIEQGQKLMTELKGMIAGPALPDYVLYSRRLWKNIVTRSSGDLPRETPKL